MPVTSLIPQLAESERARFRYAAAGFMCVCSAALVARAAGDALFLGRFSAEFLPYMYIGSATLISLAAYSYASMAGKVAPERLIVGAAGLFALLTLGLRLSLTSELGLIRILAYFMADLIVHFPMMLFWGFAALLFNPREGKRLFGVIGAAGTAACIGAGFVVRPFCARLGAENLWLIVTALMIGFGASVAGLTRREPARFRGARGETQPGTIPSRFGYFFELLRTSQVRTLALLTFVTTVVLVIVDFKFKAAVRSHYSGDLAGLAGFLGTFFGFANLIGLALQLFVVHRALRRVGVLGTLAALPSGLLLGSLGAGIAGTFAATVVMKIVDPIFNFTLNSAAIQMLYLGIKKQTRSQARTLVDGIVRPVGMALTGVGLIAAANVLPPRALMSAVGVGAGIWLLLAWLGYRAYVAGLVDAVGARSFHGTEETAFSDRTLDGHMRRALLDAANDEVPDLLAVIHELGHIQPTEEVRSLLRRDDAGVKVAALGYLGRQSGIEDMPAVLAHAEHAVPAVRLAALHAVGGWATNEEVLSVLQSRLEDGEASVRAAAAAELINSGDLDGLLAAGFALRVMLKSTDVACRVAATDALAHMRHGQLDRLLTVLLQDSDRNVRLAALGACRSNPTPSLVQPILALLSQPYVGSTAAHTLAAFGKIGLSELGHYFRDSRVVGVEPGAYRVPGILARIGDPEGLSILEPVLGATDVGLRSAVIAAYSQLLLRQASLKKHLKPLEASIGRESAAAASRSRSLRLLQGADEAGALSAALADELQSHLRNLLALLGVRARQVDMSTLYSRIVRATGEARAQALEVLDNILQQQQRSELMPLFEPGDDEALSAEPDEALAEQHIRELIESDSGSPWVAIWVLHSAAERNLGSCREACHRWLDHLMPAVRETALYAVSKLEDVVVVSQISARMVDDPSADVRRLAERLVQSAPSEI